MEKFNLKSDWTKVVQLRLKAVMFAEHSVNFERLKGEWKKKKKKKPLGDEKVLELPSLCGSQPHNCSLNSE